MLVRLEAVQLDLQVPLADPSAPFQIWTGPEPLDRWTGGPVWGDGVFWTAMEDDPDRTSRLTGSEPNPELSHTVTNQVCYHGDRC